MKIRRCVLTPVIALAKQFGGTTLRNYSDTPPAGNVFYQVTAPRRQARRPACIMAR